MSDSKKYQYSVFLNGNRSEQLVIRTDTFEELLEAKKNINKIIDKVEKKALDPNTTPDPDPNWMQQTVKRIKCNKCGENATMKSGVGKTGKAWKGIFCSSGDRTHTVWLLNLKQETK